MIILVKVVENVVLFTNLEYYYNGFQWAAPPADAPPRLSGAGGVVSREVPAEQECRKKCSRSTRRWGSLRITLDAGQSTDHPARFSAVVRRLLDEQPAGLTECSVSSSHRMLGPRLSALSGRCPTSNQLNKTGRPGWDAVISRSHIFRLIKNHSFRELVHVSVT